MQTGGRQLERELNCNIYADFSRMFLLKCRNDGELPMKNDDFALKNGHLFCNWRYADTASAMGGRVTDWREAASSIRTEGGEGSHSMLVVCAQAHSIIMWLKGITIINVIEGYYCIRGVCLCLQRAAQETHPLFDTGMLVRWWRFAMVILEEWLHYLLKEWLHLHIFTQPITRNSVGLLLWLHVVVVRIMILVGAEGVACGW